MISYLNLGAMPGQTECYDLVAETPAWEEVSLISIAGYAKCKEWLIFIPTAV